MELPSKIIQQTAFITRPKKEEHMLIVMDKSMHEDYLTYSLKPKNKQLEVVVPFFTGYNGIFNITNNNNKFCFRKSINDEHFSKIIIPSGAYEIESLSDEKNVIFLKKFFYRS